MKAFLHHSHQLPFPEEMSGQAETFPGSSSTDRRCSSVSDAAAPHYINTRKKKIAKRKPAEEMMKKKRKWEGEDPPLGYIHVRARRGQATDSHSLAERVRREKISERMKVLQGLVPGCEKVVGKALMLDEIINYVQSLQNQVEFLSMKLACVSPMLFDFSLDYDDSLAGPTEFDMVGSNKVAMELSLLQAGSFIQPAAAAADLIMNSPSTLLHRQGPTHHQLPQGDGGGGFMQVGDMLLNNMCQFQ